MDARKGIVVSRTNLIDSKKEVVVPWKGVILIIVLTIMLWAGAFAYYSVSKKKIVELQGLMNSARQSRDYQKIATVADSENRLNSINKLLGERTDWEKLLKKIEESTLPEITFSKMDSKITSRGSQSALSAPSTNPTTESEKCELDVKGTTIGLNNLAKQIMAFEGNKNNNEEALAEEVSIQKIDMKKTESGDVDKGDALDFSIGVQVNPNIIKNDFNN